MYLRKPHWLVKKMTERSRLKVDRTLLCPSFQGYKLKALDVLDGDHAEALEHGIGMLSRTLLPVSIQVDKVPSSSATPFRKLEDRGRFNHLFLEQASSNQGVFFIDGQYTVWYACFDALQAR
jgi:hypothetical protein